MPKSKKHVLVCVQGPLMFDQPVKPLLAPADVWA